ncbi:MAG TPA: hypothetical protein VF464_00970 [Candidatus Methylomirabilis sp.]
MASTGATCRVDVISLSRMGFGFSPLFLWLLDWWHMTSRRAFIAIAVLVSLLGCRARPEPVVIPPEMQGVWKTADPRYANRFFELSVNAITLGLGEGGDVSYPIVKFGKSQELQGTVYSLSYKNLAEGVTDTVLFTYQSRDGGVIRLKNQPNIEWKKEGKAVADESQP